MTGAKGRANMITIFLKQYWVSLLKWGGIALAIALVLLRVREGGKQVVKIEQLERRHEARTQSIADAKAIRRNAHANDAAQRLRERFNRNRR